MIYIATVWMQLRGHENEPSTRKIIRLPAKSAQHFRAAIELLWPGHVVTFGPVSEANDQTAGI